MTINYTPREITFENTSGREELILSKIIDLTQSLVDLAESLSPIEVQALPEILSKLQGLQNEQESLKGEILRLKQQLTFYSSFDQLLYNSLKQPVSQTMETVRSIIEKAQVEAERIVANAKLQSDLMLNEARFEEAKRAKVNSTWLALANIEPAEAQEEANPVVKETPLTLDTRFGEGAVDLVITGFKTFSQVVEFQKALAALPEIIAAKVRFIQKGILNMEVRHQTGADLAARLSELPGLDLSLTARDGNSLRFEARVMAKV